MIRVNAIVIVHNSIIFKGYSSFSSRLLCFSICKEVIQKAVSASQNTMFIELANRAVMANDNDHITSRGVRFIFINFSLLIWIKIGCSRERSDVMLYYSPKGEPREFSENYT